MHAPNPEQSEPNDQLANEDLSSTHTFEEDRSSSVDSPILGRRVRVMQSQIEGMMEGLAIGDALGLPVETLSYREISDTVGEVRDYLPLNLNPFFKDTDLPPGTISDDTQLSLALMRALQDTERGQRVSRERIAEEHIDAYQATTKGWGGSTREGVARLIEGVPWSEAGLSDKPGRGTGNGVAMKISPVGAYALLTEMEESEFVQLVADISAMTHPTSLAVSSGLAQAAAVIYCLGTGPEEFSTEDFIEFVSRFSAKGKDFYAETLSEDDLTQRLREIDQYLDSNIETIAEAFGGGSCYVYNSLPFTHTLFLQNPHRSETLFKVVNAGGDTDSNASMAGALLGALHGKDLFEDRLIEGLGDRAALHSETERFCQILFRPKL